MCGDFSNPTWQTRAWVQQAKKHCGSLLQWNGTALRDTASLYNLCAILCTGAWKQPFALRAVSRASEPRLIFAPCIFCSCGTNSMKFYLLRKIKIPVVAFDVLIVRYYLTSSKCMHFAYFTSSTVTHSTQTKPASCPFDYFVRIRSYIREGICATYNKQNEGSKKARADLCWSSFLERTLGKPGYTM